MTNSLYKRKYPKLERRDNPLQWQGRMELNTDRDGEGDDEMDLTVRVDFSKNLILGEI
jgi:hypothetical protein